MAQFPGGFEINPSSSTVAGSLSNAANLYAQLQQVKAQQRELDMRKKDQKMDFAIKIMHEAPKQWKLKAYENTIRPLWKEATGEDLPVLEADDFSRPAFDRYIKSDSEISKMNIPNEAKDQMRRQELSRALWDIGEEKQGLMSLFQDGGKTPGRVFKYNQDTGEVFDSSGNPVPLNSITSSDKMISYSPSSGERSRGNLEIRRDSEIEKIVQKFKTDKRVTKAYQSIDSSSDILEFVDSGNPIAASAIPTYAARMSGEVGALSEADKAPFGGSRAILKRIEQSLKQMADGKLSEDNKRFMTEFTGLVNKRAYEKIYSEAVNTSKQKKGLFGLSEEDLLKKLYQGPDFNTNGSGNKILENTIRPNPGHIDNGYRFKGGDPSDAANWEKL